jgi:2',3'-cyclic-nucleotide 2'-phosphodiesterase (5'-nucleotidase family)
MRFLAWSGLLLIACLVAFAAGDDPSAGPTVAGQSVADVLKDFSHADGALVPAGVIASPLQHNDLSTMLASESDKLVVVDLTGAQLKTAFEKSVMLYPQPNVGFLQVSGFEITFGKSGSLNSRVTDVQLNGSKLEESRTYEIAMPSSLQRGQFGYSDIWDKAKIVRTFEKADLGSVLRGKHVSQSQPRWLSR